jgi:hypothetical protein
MCLRVLALTDFPRHRLAPDGRRYQCQKCTNKLQREYRKKIKSGVSKVFDRDGLTKAVQSQTVGKSSMSDHRAGVKPNLVSPRKLHRPTTGTRAPMSAIREVPGITLHGWNEVSAIGR